VPEHTEHENEVPPPVQEQEALVPEHKRLLAAQLKVEPAPEQ